MTAALGQHGHGLEAIVLFEQMLMEDIVPDLITFLTIFSASSHAGSVKGHRYFNSMHVCYDMVLGEDHYAQLIDLLV